MGWAFSLETWVFCNLGMKWCVYNVYYRQTVAIGIRCRGRDRNGFF